MLDTIEFEYRMDYDPTKRLLEVRRAISRFINRLNEKTDLNISNDSLDEDSEKILLLYNEIVHSEGKAFLNEANKYVSRSKMIAATHFAIMCVLPIKSKASYQRISQLDLNAIFCWFTGICLIIDFPSKNDKTRSLKQDFEANPGYKNLMQNYIRWLSIKKVKSRPVLITSWFFDLVTEFYILEN